jgi:hypothetical protein
MMKLCGCRVEACQAPFVAGPKGSLPVFIDRVDLVVIDVMRIPRITEIVVDLAGTGIEAV